MKNYILALIISITVVFSSPALAQTDVSAISAHTKCDGPKELCDQILSLNGKLAEQKSVLDKINTEKTEAQKQQEKVNQDRTMKLIAVAGVMAAVLKALLSALSGWKDYFKTDKGKAWVKVITLVIGFLAFILSNIGFGIPWWQALIVAGGGPGAILIHELSKLVPVLEGKKPLPPESNQPEKMNQPDPEKNDQPA